MEGSCWRRERRGIISIISAIDAVKVMYNMTISPCLCFAADSKRSWVTSVYPFVMCPPPGNLRLTSWRPRTWRRWMLEDCQVRQHTPARVLGLLFSCSDAGPLLLPVSQIRLSKWCCSTMGSDWRRKRRQSNKTRWTLTSTRALASRSPSPRFRLVRLRLVRLHFWKKFWAGSWHSTTLASIGSANP